MIFRARGAHRDERARSLPPKADPLPSQQSATSSRSGLRRRFEIDKTARRKALPSEVAPRHRSQALRRWSWWASEPELSLPALDRPAMTLVILDTIRDQGRTTRGARPEAPDHELLGAPLNEHLYELQPIGWVESPLLDRDSAPSQGDQGAPDAWLVFEEAMDEGLRNLEDGVEIIVLTWLDRAHRDVLRVHPGGDPANPETGVFSTRSPDRPNPIGLQPGQGVVDGRLENQGQQPRCSRRDADRGREARHSFARSVRRVDGRPGTTPFLHQVPKPFIAQRRSWLRWKRGWPDR